MRKKYYKSIDCGNRIKGLEKLLTKEEEKEDEDKS